MFTISEVARRFGLSRSTLLYYDRIGLLKPSGRSDSNYRLYSQADLDRMEIISRYREAGVPLADVALILSSQGEALAAVLEARLVSLRDEMKKLRTQERALVELLENEAAASAERPLDKARWIAILRAAGMNDEDMKRWHVEFERLCAEGHEDFLESLGLGEEEVVRIREWSRGTRADGSDPKLR